MSQQKVAAFTDPRLYALNLISAQLANSKQPLVPERVVLLGGNDGAQNGAEVGLFQAIMQMLAAWQHIAEPPTAMKPEPPRDLAA